MHALHMRTYLPLRGKATVKIKMGTFINFLFKGDIHVLNNDFTCILCVFLKELLFFKGLFIIFKRFLFLLFLYIYIRNIDF